MTINEFISSSYQISEPARAGAIYVMSHDIQSDEWNTDLNEKTKRIKTDPPRKL